MFKYKAVQPFILKAIRGAGPAYQWPNNSLDWAFVGGGRRWLVLVPKPSPAVGLMIQRWAGLPPARVMMGARWSYCAPMDCPSLSLPTFQRALADLREQGALIRVPLVGAHRGSAMGDTTPELWAEYQASNSEGLRGLAAAQRLTGALARWGVDVVTTGGEGAGVPVEIQVKGAESLEALAGLIARLQH